MNKLLIVFGVAACLITAIALNIRVATGCNFVTGKIGSGRDAVTVRLGIFNYAIETPSGIPEEPSSAPTLPPTEEGATARPTAVPKTGVPSMSPTQAPTATPSSSPSWFPSQVGDTPRPTNPPTTSFPSRSPSVAPSYSPSYVPTPSPTTEMPSRIPTASPSTIPTTAPVSTSAPTPNTIAPETPVPTLMKISTPQPTLMPVEALMPFPPIMTPLPTTFVPTISSAPSISPAPTNFTIISSAPSISPAPTTPNTLTPTSSLTLFSISVRTDNSRWLRDNNNHQFLDGTDGDCVAVSELEDDADPWKNTAAQAGAILAPLAGILTLILVGMTPIVVRSARQKLPYLLWPGLILCQVGTGLLWTVLNVEECQEDNNNNTILMGGCELSRGANMTIAAHVLYALAALGSFALPTAEAEEVANEADEDVEKGDDDGFTLINTALLDAATVGGDDDRIDELQAQLEAQKMAQAMEAGKAQGLNDQLKEQQEELEATKQELLRAKQEAEEQRNALAAAAAMKAAEEAAEALRAKELEDKLKQQTAELEEARNIMDDMEDEIDKKEAMIAALTAKGKKEAAAEEAAKVKQLQRELEAQKDEYDRKLRALQGPELSYYPAVWKWLGFKDPFRKEFPYYPEVWSFLGFKEPSKEAFVIKRRAPDPEGATWKDLQAEIVAYEAMIKSLEAQKEALDAAASATAEAQALKEELEYYKKQMEEIKNKAEEMKKDDPPMADPPVKRNLNPDAKQPSGRIHAEVLAVTDMRPRFDPPEEMVADPSKDPDGVRKSVTLEKDESCIAQEDPPDRTPIDPTNDPDSGHLAEKPTAADPPRENPAAVEPIEVRSSAVKDSPPVMDPPRKNPAAVEPDEVRSSAIKDSPPVVDPPRENPAAVEPVGIRSSAVNDSPPVVDPPRVNPAAVEPVGIRSSTVREVPLDPWQSVGEEPPEDNQSYEPNNSRQSAGGEDPSPFPDYSEASEVEGSDVGQAPLEDSDLGGDEPPIDDQVDYSEQLQLLADGEDSMQSPDDGEPSHLQSSGDGQDSPSDPGPTSANDAESPEVERQDSPADIGPPYDQKAQ